MMARRLVRVDHLVLGDDNSVLSAELPPVNNENPQRVFSH